MDWTEKRLKDFEIFLKKVFGFIHKDINLIAVHCSLLVFVCSTPFFMAGVIIRIVKESEALLLEFNVVSIVVGDDAVFLVRLCGMAILDIFIDPLSGTFSYYTGNLFVCDELVYKILHLTICM